MPRPAGEQESVQSGRLAVKDVYDNARSEAGYRMGWRDSHRMSRPSHGRTRKKYEEYDAAYAAGWEGGREHVNLITGEHPCPEWDEVHRGGPIGGRGLPLDCPWNQVGE